MDETIPPPRYSPRKLAGPNRLAMNVDQHKGHVRLRNSRRNSPGSGGTDKVETQHVQCDVRRVGVRETACQEGVTVRHRAISAS